MNIQNKLLPYGALSSISRKVGIDRDRLTYLITKQEYDGLEPLLLASFRYHFDKKKADLIRYLDTSDDAHKRMCAELKEAFFLKRAEADAFVKNLKKTRFTVTGTDMIDFLHSVFCEPINDR
jgi:DNA topoisomerase VI subunit B